MSLKIFQSHTPDPDDIKYAKKNIGRSDCPRRYCWYWHSLQFDFELDVEEGCTLPEQVDANKEYTPEIPYLRTCCRASNNSQHPDYYEPREPHLVEDGFPMDYFFVVRKKHRVRKYERRKRLK